jgi:ketopantoate reductase
MTTREEIFLEVAKELDRQEVKWGVQNHTPEHWFMILGEEVGEACTAALECKVATLYRQAHLANDQAAQYRRECIQVAAVAMAMVASHDRNYREQHHETR